MVDEAEGRRRAVIGRGSEKAEKPVSGCGRRVRNWLSLADRREWEVVKTREFRSGRRGDYMLSGTLLVTARRAGGHTPWLRDPFLPHRCLTRFGLFR